jgi:hypothetical protein
MAGLDLSDLGADNRATTRGGWLVQELFPIGCGVVLGALAGWLRPPWRWPVTGVLAIGLGVAATVVSGEAEISWAFVLIDIPMVAVAASVGFLSVHRLGPSRGKEEHEEPR